jgi:hypothetical protein
MVGKVDDEAWACEEGWRREAADDEGGKEAGVVEV